MNSWNERKSHDAADGDGDRRGPIQQRFLGCGETQERAARWLRDQLASRGHVARLKALKKGDMVTIRFHTDVERHRIDAMQVFPAKPSRKLPATRKRNSGDRLEAMPLPVLPDEELGTYIGRRLTHLRHRPSVTVSSRSNSVTRCCLSSVTRKASKKPSRPNKRGASSAAKQNGIVNRQRASRT